MMPPESDGETADRNTLPTAEVGAAADRALRCAFHAQVARYCPPWLKDHVDDIVHVAWMRLHEAQRKSERNRNPGPSLIAKVAYCATIDEIRRHRRRKEVPVESFAEIPSPATVNPARATSAREIGTGIRNCLSRLIPNRRLAVTLYLQGHSAPDTGRILEWPLKRAENMIFRGMADLRRCLVAKGLRP